jgi:hypothetical protein
VDLELPLPPGSKSSARSHGSHAREPGDLEGAGGSMVDRRHGREGNSRNPQKSFEESDARTVPTCKKSAKTWVTPVEPMEGKRCNCVCRNFPENPAYSSCGDVPARQRRTPGARRASHFTVACHALLARLPSTDGEVIGDLSTATEVHLVGCLAFKRAVGDSLVVLGHLELDEPLDGREVVERVQEQPPMF